MNTTTKPEHTPEPWHVEQMDGWSVLAYANNGSQPVVLAGKSAYCDRVKNKENAEANIAHAVACVNALAGLNPEAVGAVVEALERLVHVIDAAGLPNLTKGVQLGQMSWYHKAHDRMTAARTALAALKAGGK